MARWGWLGRSALLALVLPKVTALGMEAGADALAPSMPRVFGNYTSQRAQNPPRIHGTGGWLLDSPQFAQWLVSRASLLHVAAEPGWGKSVLARYVLEEAMVQQQPPPPPPLLLSFFFRKGQGKQDRVETALAAMAHQLWEQQARTLEIPFPDVDSADHDPEQLMDELCALILHHTRFVQGGIVCVIDGLDECQPAGRDRFIAMLLDFVASAAVGWQGSAHFNRFLLTSSPDFEIDFEIDHPSGVRPLPFTRLDGFERTQVTADELNACIQDSIPQLLAKHPPVFQQNVAKQLQSIENKTPLLLQLAFDHLQAVEAAEGAEREMEDSVVQLMSGLDQAYEMMLSKHPNAKLKRSLLLIIAAARRPLSLSELQVALKLSQTDPNDIQKLSDIAIESDQAFEHTLKLLCGSFLQIHERKVYFVHNTAREFILSPKDADQHNSLQWRGSIDMASAEATLGKACLILLSLEDFGGTAPWLGQELDPSTFYDGNQHAKWINQRPLFQYAAANWVYHYGAVEQEFYPTLYSSFWKLVEQTSPAFQHWQPVFIVEEKQHSDSVTHNLALFAHLGLSTIVERLIDQGADLNAPDQYFGTPLSAASRQGHKHVVKLLLQRGASVIGPGNPGLKAVESATERAQEVIVQLLLASGASSATKEDYNPALGAAVRKSHLGIARLLLEHGADANGQVESENTALVFAVRKGDQQMVQLLVESGADIDARTEGCMPVHAAVTEWNEGMTHLLLKLGASVDILDARNKPALWVAVRDNNEKMVQILLDAGASVDPLPGSWEPDGLLVESLEVVQLLLQHGLDVSSEFSTNLLDLAIQEGHLEMIELIRAHHPNLDIQSKTGESMLHMAARDQNLDLVTNMLTRGADPNARNDTGATPLHAVAATEPNFPGEISGQLVAEALLNHGASVSIQDDSGATPLRLAVNYGHTAVVRTLLAGGADAKARWRHTEGEGTTTALHVALAPEHGESTEEIVKLLLDHGAEVDAREDNTGATALHLAMQGCCPTTARLLINHGANVTAQRRSKVGSVADDWSAFGRGETPLLTAAFHPPYLSKEHEYAKVVQLLIERGADPGDYGADERNALLAAAFANNVVMVWVLLEQLKDVVVDVHVRDSEGNTPLMLAARSLLDDIPRMLLANGARVDDRDAEGRTALDFARQRGADEVVDCLLEYAKDSEAARGRVVHPMTLSDPRERLRLSLNRAVRQLESKDDLRVRDEL